MNSPKLPIGEGNVPDKALEELLAAFAAVPPGTGDDINFDDPSIDQLLGLAPDKTPVPAADDPPPAAVTTAVTEQVPAQPADDAPARKPIQIGGDDLPDPLYLNEEAEERLRGTSGRATELSVREERHTILIGGDEIEGSSGGIPIATGSTMDPRLRARRIAVKRAVGRRRLKWFLIIGAFVIVITAGLALLGSSLFAIEEDRIAVSGARRIDQDDLDAAIAELAGHPVLLVDTATIEDRLERSPWVAEARVTTDFPHSATIELRERVPIATYAGSDGRFRIIDVDGKVVEVLAGRPVEFMQLTGPAANAERGDTAGVGFIRAAELVESLSPAVRSRTASVGVSDTGELSLSFHSDVADDADEGTVVVLGGPTELLDKLTRLEALLKNSDIAGCVRIDVSTPEVGRECPP